MKKICATFLLSLNLVAFANTNTTAPTTAAAATATATATTSASATANASAIDGYWSTIDDKTGKPKAFVEIITKDNIIYAIVRGGYPVNGVVPHNICSKCPSPFTNQPVTNMQIMWGVSYNANDKDYDGGQILDPDSGNIYRVMLTPSADNQSLKVHGYIGIPLLGRTQMWYRLTTDQFNALMKEYPQ